MAQFLQDEGMCPDFRFGLFTWWKETPSYRKAPAWAADVARRYPGTAKQAKKWLRHGATSMDAPGWRQDWLQRVERVLLGICIGFIAGAR